MYIYTMLSNRFFWTLENQMKGLCCCFLWTIFGGWIWPKRQFFQGFKLWWELYICILPWHSAVTICVGKLPFRHVYFQVRSFVEGKTTTLVGYTVSRFGICLLQWFVVWQFEEYYITQHRHMQGLVCLQGKILGGQFESNSSDGKQVGSILERC